MNIIKPKSNYYPPTPQIPMRKLITLMPYLRFSVSVVFLISILIRTYESAPSYFSHYCSELFSTNNTSLANLNTLLNSLSSNSNVTGFLNTTAGHVPDTLHGFFLCRGDISTETCEDCVAFATKDIVQRCPMDKEAIVWYDECSLRYSNRTTSYDMPWDFTDPNNTEQSRFNEIIDDKDAFNELLSETLNDVASQVVYVNSGDPKFSTKEATFSGDKKIYSLAQCLPDLSSVACHQCLGISITTLSVCCNRHFEGRAQNPSCRLQYQVSPIYYTTRSSPPKQGLPGKRQVMSPRTMVTIIVPTVGMVMVLCTLCFYVLRWKARKQTNDMINKDVDNEIASLQSLQFELCTIEAATNNFSDENNIGAGGFGNVYKGQLPDGQKIAVKKLSSNSEQGAQEFKTEVVLVAKLQHRNLARLLGFCLQGAEKILIYEFAPNKSLDYFIFDSQRQGQLDWSRRYKIIKGTARGLLYLHEESRLKIIHRDLKASNILLDGEMNPKISDFGMAKLVGIDQSRGITNRIVGTYGYMSPEYAMRGRFSVKSDVFSFGVLLLEIICGKKNSGFHVANHYENLLSYAWRCWSNQTSLELMDPTLENSYSRIEVIRCIQIGLLCVQENPSHRPTMTNIVAMLNSLSVTLPSPRRPGFFVGSRTTSQMGTELIQASVNEASITFLSGR